MIDENMARNGSITLPECILMTGNNENGVKNKIKYVWK